MDSKKDPRKRYGHRGARRHCWVLGKIGKTHRIWFFTDRGVEDCHEQASNIDGGW